MEIPILISAFFIGVAGSFHCAGMCGPLMLTFLYNDNNGLSIKKWITYHSGRILTYTIWGMIWGLIGTSLKLFGWQQEVSISIGIMSIIGVLILKFVPKIDTTIGGIYIFKYLYHILFDKERKYQNNQILLKGIINGFLPCGLVYIAIAGATAMQHPLYGGVFMFFFGLGTLPILLLIFFMGKQLVSPIRKYAIAFYPYMIILIGILLIIRGMNLGNYFSPALMKSASSHVVCIPK